VPGSDADLAVSCALLHDTIEDTGTTHAEIADRFDPVVADGVLATAGALASAPTNLFAANVRSTKHLAGLGGRLVLCGFRILT
jgi:hypothetical protein